MKNKNCAWTIATYGLISLVFFFTHNPTYGASLYSKMKKGTTLYRDNKYDEALKTFIDAQIELPEDPRLKYNIANTHYQMRNYEEAVKNYLDVAATAQDVQLEEQSLYNIGNCMYRQGKLEEAITYYQKALELDPNDQDAKYNLEFVREEIKKRVNQALQREQEQKHQEKSSQEENQQQQEAGTSQEQRQSPQLQEMQEQPPQQTVRSTPSEEEHDTGGEQRVEARPMTKEEAERWLKSINEGKRDYRNQGKELGGGSYRPQKDW